MLANASGLVEMTPQKAAKQGLNFLAQAQQPSGAFTTTRAVKPDMLNAQPFPCVFITPFILHVLEKIDAPIEMIERGRGYLQATMELGWAWRFYGPGTHLPLDWDDTACSLVALADPGVWKLALRHRAAYRRADGWHWTWMLDMAPRDGRVKKNDIDPVVNANVLFWLARAGVDDKKLARNLQTWVTWGEFLKTTIYYDSPFPFAYCLSRAATDGPVPALNGAVQQVAEGLIALREEQTGWGNALWNALALVTLLNAGYWEHEVVQLTVERLLEMQQPDGGWPNAPFFPGQPGLFYGSRELTTAIALEGLVGYDRLSGL
jgi:hypothetical protein